MSTFSISLSFSLRKPANHHPINRIRGYRKRICAGVLFHPSLYCTHIRTRTHHGRLSRCNISKPTHLPDSHWRLLRVEIHKAYQHTSLSYIHTQAWLLYKVVYVCVCVCVEHLYNLQVASARIHYSRVNIQPGLFSIKLIFDKTFIVATCTKKHILTRVLILFE